MTLGVESLDTAPAASQSQEPFAATFLPAYRRDGSVRAWSLVDCVDHEWAKNRRWYLARDGYFYRNLSHKTEGRGHIALHREVLGLEKGDGRNEGDHLNRDRLDNRRLNLRITHSSGNKQNMGTRSDNRLGRGVKFHEACKSRPWQARCQVEGKEISLGYFATQQEAADAAKRGRERFLPYATD